MIGDDDEEDQEDSAAFCGNEDEDEDKNDDVDGQDSENDDILDRVTLDSSCASVQGLRAEEQIESSKVKACFKVRADDDDRFFYIHKRTACWLLNNDKKTLSSDRLKRVAQSSNEQWTLLEVH